jgi:hypothetical protein
MVARAVERLTYGNVVATLALVVAVAGGGWAIGKLPDSQGRITACYVPKDVKKRVTVRGRRVTRVVKRKGSVRMLVTGTRCTRGEAKLVWNQRGPQGPPGAPGAGARTASANTANALPPNSSGTLLTTAIQAPGPGTLTIVASAEASYGSSGTDQFECFLQIDEATVAESTRVLQTNASVGSEENCATNATRPVGAGSHKVDLEATNVSAMSGTDFGPAELSVIFTPA